MHPSIQYIEKIILNNKNIKVEEVRRTSTTLFIKLTNDNNIYILLIKEAFENKIVINTTNPVNFEDMSGVENPYEVANKFNKHAIGVKCIKMEKEEGTFIFSREEVLNIKDCKNEKLINQKLSLSFEMLTASPELLLKYLEERDERK